jgi:hypothetical protein
MHSDRIITDLQAAVLIDGEIAKQSRDRVGARPARQEQHEHRQKTHDRREVSRTSAEANGRHLPWR